jgi:hypothetical protein
MPDRGDIVQLYGCREKYIVIGAPGDTEYDERGYVGERGCVVALLDRCYTHGSWVDNEMLKPYKEKTDYEKKDYSWIDEGLRKWEKIVVELEAGRYPDGIGGSCSFCEHYGINLETECNGCTLFGEICMPNDAENKAAQSAYAKALHYARKEQYDHALIEARKVVKAIINVKEKY